MARQAEVHTTILMLHGMQWKSQSSNVSRWQLLHLLFVSGFYSNGSSYDTQCNYHCLNVLLHRNHAIPEQYGKRQYEAEGNQYHEVHTANTLY